MASSILSHTVSANAEVDLLLEGVGLESLGDTKDSILLKTIRLALAPTIASLSTSIGRQTYRRTLGNVRPGRGMSNTDESGAHVSIAGNSRAAGDAQRGKHCDRQQGKMED